MRLRVLASPASLHDPSSPSARLVTRKSSSRPALHRPFHFLRSSDSHRNNYQSTVLASPSSMILGKRASYAMSSSFMLGPGNSGSRRSNS
ncbi:hypothetical protein KSP39_PZI008782 [Platanthera zijinensis]|uniref:Uncharacterized protein n=1 Tax=Platanthera zijinensis TaxID=2320716 RepID=A0AAP0BLX2_9ASPA